MGKRTYICIDLKSFYASVECVARGLDPLRTNLVVADKSRTDKTVCLAVTPPMKAYGLSGRSRLFEVISKVREVNAARRKNTPFGEFMGTSFDDCMLKNDPELKLDYIVAPPRMAHYMDVSSHIYDIYLRHVSHEDIFAYSIDEVFIDATAYLHTLKITGREFAMRMIKDVLLETGITATAGVGTNMYLAKIAMDIMAKKMPADKDGVRIAELNEYSYREELWDHRPLTDFWRVGHGYATKLSEVGLYTMGDIALCSAGEKGSYYSEDLLYKLFGVNAELLIDHAWGYEPTTIADVKSYKPSSNSISSGQVLTVPYTADKARLIVREMTDLLVLDLVEKGLVTDQIVLTIGYDVENITNTAISSKYSGEIVIDRYGRQIPKHSHGTQNLKKKTSSTNAILAAVTELYDRIINKELLVRRINVVANKVVPEGEEPDSTTPQQMSFFDILDQNDEAIQAEKRAEEKEKKVQRTLIDIKKKHGKNAIVKGMNLEEGATAMERNKQVGGHKA
ncbi:MAG: DNA methylase [Clostridia bacterium]|nr:DNA methylase [Clostridia bacterium]